MVFPRPALAVAVALAVASAALAPAPAQEEREYGGVITGEGIQRIAIGIPAPQVRAPVAASVVAELRQVIADDLDFSLYFRVLPQDAPRVDPDEPRFGPWATAGASQVSLEVFNSLGQRVAILLEGESLAPGLHRIRWNGRDQAGRLMGSGVYFYRLSPATGSSSRSSQLVRRMLLLK